jgi:hypothetical protein
MPIRKSVEEKLVVKGDREDWLDRCALVMREQGFKRVQCSETLYQITGDWKPAIGTLYGDLQITLLPEGDGMTHMQITGTGAVDNVFALFGSPGKRLIEKFKSGIK